MNSIWWQYCFEAEFLSYVERVCEVDQQASTEGRQLESANAGVKRKPSEMESNADDEKDDRSSSPKRTMPRSLSSSSIGLKKRTPKRKARETKSTEKKRRLSDEGTSSPPGRPKRAVAPKTFPDQTLGISWKEENQLQKALYASLHSKSGPSRAKSESDLRTASTTDSEASNGRVTPDCRITRTEGLACDDSASDSGSKDSKNNGSKTTLRRSESLLKASLRAQRKFAQGSRPCSPSTTPVKAKPASSSKLVCPDIGICRSKTEDFLTFLCLRGTSKLPSHLEHFNQPEVEESSSYPSTPRGHSQESSRASTPSHYNSRPATPSHSERKRKKRHSPDREILMDNQELGVKPLDDANAKIVWKKPLIPSQRHPAPFLLQLAKKSPPTPLRFFHLPPPPVPYLPPLSPLSPLPKPSSTTLDPMKTRLPLLISPVESGKSNEQLDWQLIKENFDRHHKFLLSFHSYCKKGANPVAPSPHYPLPPSKPPVPPDDIPLSKQSSLTLDAPISGSVREDRSASMNSKKLKKGKMLSMRVLRSGSMQNIHDAFHTKTKLLNKAKLTAMRSKQRSDRSTSCSRKRQSHPEVVAADSTSVKKKTEERVPDPDIIIIDDSPDSKPGFRASRSSSRTPSPRKALSLSSRKLRDKPVITDAKSPSSPVPTLSLSFRESFPNPDDLPRIVQIPTYHPSAEEFSDPISYMSLIQPDAESYGICKIIPPEGWKPECKLSEELRFSTQVQHIHRLMNRWGPNVQQLKCIKKHLEQQGNPMDHTPLVCGVELDMAALSNAISTCGGLQAVINKNKWGKVAEILRIPKPAGEVQGRLYELYCRYLLSFDTLSAEEKRKLQNQVESERTKQQKDGLLDVDCMLKGRSRTLSEIFRASRNMQAMWFKDGVDPSPPQVENEYWRLVEGAKHHVSVQVGYMDTQSHCSAFPTKRDSPYSKHGWNFNMLPQNTENVLRHAGLISGFTVAMLHIGMLFSSKCWYRDPHHLPQIHYLHSGADMLWYCVPKSEVSKLKNVMHDTCGDLIEKDSDLWLPPDSVMLSPGLLVEKGLNLCRAVQQPNEFMIVFPEAFTANVSCGYNIAETVHFASADWIPSGWKAMELLHENREADVIPIERIIVKLARSERTPVGTLSLLLPHLKTFVAQEIKLRKELSEMNAKRERFTSNNKCLASIGRRRGHIGWGLSDDLHHCCICNRYCFLSMVVNESEGQMFCLKDSIKHLQKKKKNLKASIMLYRHPTRDLEEIVSNVLSRVAAEETSRHKGPRIKQASN